MGAAMGAGAAAGVAITVGAAAVQPQSASATLSAPEEASVTGRWFRRFMGGPRECGRAARQEAIADDEAGRTIFLRLSYPLPP